MDSEIETTAFLLYVGQSGSIIKTPMYNDGSKEPPQLASLLDFCPVFSNPHNQMLCFTCTRSVHLWLQSRQQNYVTNSNTTLSTPVLETSITVENVSEGEKNNEPYDIVTDSNSSFTASIADTVIRCGVHMSEASIGEDKMTISEGGSDNKPYGVNVTDILSDKVFTTTTTPTMPHTPSSTTAAESDIKIQRVLRVYLTSDGSYDLQVFASGSSAWLSEYILILQLIIVLLVMSLVVFCFLRFKRVRSTMDLELQELVVKPHHTSVDIDHNITDCETKKSQTTNTSTTAADKQIQTKLPDVINSRD